jgi:copper chaperone CopZ
VETITLTAPDISCAHCKSTIEREVGEMTGVASCLVHVDSKQVSVTFDPTQTTSRHIIERLDDEGYPVAGSAG